MRLILVAHMTAKPCVILLLCFIVIDNIYFGRYFLLLLVPLLGQAHN